MAPSPQRQFLDFPTNKHTSSITPSSATFLISSSNHTGAAWNNTSAKVQIIEEEEDELQHSSKQPIIIPSTTVPSTSTNTTTAIEAISELSSESSSGYCQVCHQQEARYTCPKCRLPYCSVACYRHHNTNTNKTNNNTSSSSSPSLSSSSCTESFYKSRVQAVLKMEQKEHSQQLQQTLRRIYNDNYHHQPFNEDYNEMDNIHYDDDNDDDEEDDDEQLDDNHDQVLSRTELIQLSQLLSEVGGNEEVLESLLSSPRIQMALQKALQDEELQPYLIVPWHPWWMPDFAAKLHPNNHHHDLDRLGDATAVVVATTTTITSVSDNADDDDDDDDESTLPSLDERLLQIPPFSTLIKNTLPSPLLVYNLVDVLYSIVRTLRLYNGVDDAMSVAMEAVTTVLIPSSMVLSHDARYTSVAHVLTECTRSSTAALRQAGSSSSHVGLCNTPWTVLVEDVAILVSNGRFVARALLEAIDLIQAAIMSAEYDHHSNNDNNNKRKKQSKQRRNVNRSLPLKPCLKKLEYYLSWSRHVFSAGSMSMDASLLVAEIRSWARDWSAPPEGNSN